MSKTKRALILSALLLMLAACGREPIDQQPDAAAKATAGEPAGRLVSVSGLSSGGYMATQLHIAHSETIAAAGLIAGGPYGCSEGNLMRALSLCSKGGGFDPAAMRQRIESRAQAGVIDAPDNLRDDRVWLLHTRGDAVVDASVTAAAASLYSALLESGAQLVYVDDIEAAHGLPVLDSDVSCDEMRSPFLNGCGYDATGEMLKHLTGRAVTPADEAQGQLTSFAQPVASGLAAEGYRYTPPQCEGATDCGIHVALHGCQQGAAFVGERFATAAGYNRWADALDLIVVYPQVAADPSVNPFGCWDWWGYSGVGFDTKQGAQIQALMQIIESELADAP